MSVSQVFSVFSLLCNKYPLPDINSCYRYRVVSDIRNGDYTWRYRCCPSGYVFENCRCRLSIQGFDYNSVRKIYNQENTKTNGIMKNSKNFADTNDLYERQLDPRRGRIIHAKYILLEPKIVRRLRPIITVPSKIKGMPFARRSQFRRKNYPRKAFVRKLSLQEHIPMMDLQGMSQAEQFGFATAEENSVFDLNIEANPSYPHRNLKEVENVSVNPKRSKNVDIMKGNGFKITNVDSKRTRIKTDDILFDRQMVPGFIDTSVYIDGGSLPSTKKTDNIYYPLKPSYELLNNDKYQETNDNGNSLYVQDVRNAFTLKEVLANMKLYQDKYNRTNKKMKQLDKTTKSKMEMSETSIELPYSETTVHKLNILHRNGKNSTNKHFGINKISSNQSVENKKKASAFSKNDKIVTIEEKEMREKINIPGNDTVVEINGKGTGHYNYTHNNGNFTHNSVDINIDKYSVFPLDIDESVKVSQNDIKANAKYRESNIQVKGPTIIINLDENTTMTIPIALEKADGTLLNDTTMKSTVGKIPTSKIKFLDSFAVINIPVDSKENSIVKKITFQVPTKVGKFFKIMSNKDSIES